MSESGADGAQRLLDSDPPTSGCASDGFLTPASGSRETDRRHRQEPAGACSDGVGHVLKILDVWVL